MHAKQEIPYTSFLTKDKRGNGPCMLRQGNVKVMQVNC